MNNANSKKLIFVLIQLAFVLTTSAYRTWKDPNTGIEWKYERLGDDKRPDAGFPQYGGSIGVDLDDADIDKTKGHESAIPTTTKGAVVIPSHVDDGLGIFAIEEYAFYDCAGLTAVTIPEAVLKIGAMAFYNCSGLAKMAIPSKVTSIDQATFMYCTGLTAVMIPDGVTCIDSSAFNGCNRLKEVMIPSGVSRIGSYAFKGCSALQSVTLPENCVVGSLAFSGCSKLTSATIPSSVTFNGDAFYGCNLLKTIYSDDVETVKKKLRDSGMDYAQFDGLTFADLTLSHKVAIPNASTGLVYDGTTKTGVVAGTGYAVVSGGSAINAGEYAAVVRLNDGDYVWSDGTTDDKRISWKIEKATYNMSGLVFQNASFDYDGQPHSIFLSGNLPSGVVVSYVGNGKIDVGTYTVTAKFSGDSNHNEIANMTAMMTIRSASTSIEDFQIANGVLERYVGKGGAVVIPSAVTRIAAYAFEHCSRLTSVSIPSSVTSIGDWAFLDCDGLTSVTMTDDVMAIGVGAFSGCRGLVDENGFVIVKDALYGYYGTATSVTIPEGVTCIEPIAFRECSRLTSVTIPKGVTSIGSRAFEDCDGLTSVTIPDGVTSIGDYAFYCCRGLSSVVIPSSVTRIGFGAYCGCDGLISVRILDGVTSIGDLAFCCCRGLAFVSIPASVTSIGVRAFEDCSGLTSVTMPDGEISIGNMAFRGCMKLMDKTGFVIVKDVLYGYYGTATAVTIPGGVMSIGGWAFYGYGYNKGLTSVTIPTGVTSIADEAFYNCNGLKTVYVDRGEVERVKGMYAWSTDIKFVEMVPPVIEGDEGATVTGDAETGFVIKPSEGNKAVEVTIPQGVDAAKVTVEVSPKVASVKPNGAKVKIVVGENDITGYLVIPESDGVMNIAAATVKDEIVKETLDPSKDAVIELDAANPQLITAPTRKGLTYTLFEGHKLESLSKGDFIIGNGDPWKPTITVSGGDAAFYSIGVGTGE